MRLICWLALTLVTGGAATIPPAVSAEVSARGQASLLVEITKKGEDDVLDAFRAELNGACRVRHSWPRVRVTHIDATPECLRRIAVSQAVAAVDLTGSAFLVAADSLSIPRYARAAIIGGGISGDAPELREVYQQESCFCAAGCCPDGTSRQIGEQSATSGATPARSTEQLALRVARPGYSSVIDGTNISLLSIRVAEPVAGANYPAISHASILDALNWLVLEKPPVGMIVISLESDEVFCGPCESANVANRAMAAYIRQLTAQGIRVLAPDLGRRIRGIPACLPGVETFPASSDLPRLSAEAIPIGQLIAQIASIRTYSSALAPPAGWATGGQIPPQVFQITLDKPKSLSGLGGYSVTAVYSFRNFGPEFLLQSLRGGVYYLRHGSSFIFVLHHGQVSSCAPSKLLEDQPR